MSSYSYSSRHLSDISSLDTLATPESVDHTQNSHLDGTKNRKVRDANMAVPKEHDFLTADALKTHDIRDHPAHIDRPSDLVPFWLRNLRAFQYQSESLSMAHAAPSENKDGQEDISSQKKGKVLKVMSMAKFLEKLEANGGWGIIYSDDEDDIKRPTWKGWSKDSGGAWDDLKDSRDDPKGSWPTPKGAMGLPNGTWDQPSGAWGHRKGAWGNTQDIIPENGKAGCPEGNGQKSATYQRHGRGRGRGRGGRNHGGSGQGNAHGRGERRPYTNGSKVSEHPDSWNSRERNNAHAGQGIDGERRADGQGQGQSGNVDSNRRRRWNRGRGGKPATADSASHPKETGADSGQWGPDNWWMGPCWGVDGAPEFVDGWSMRVDDFPHKHSHGWEIENYDYSMAHSFGWDIPNDDAVTRHGAEDEWVDSRGHGGGNNADGWKSYPKPPTVRDKANDNLGNANSKQSITEAGTRRATKLNMQKGGVSYLAAAKGRSS